MKYNVNLALLRERERKHYWAAFAFFNLVLAFGLGACAVDLKLTNTRLWRGAAHRGR